MKWRSLDESSSAEDVRPLREILAERKAGIAKYVPAEIQSIHARVVDELRESGMASGTLSNGQVAPSFELKDQHGRVVKSTEGLQQWPLVVCFFRGRWCPFCVGQLEAMNLMVTQIQDAGASLVAISPQTVQQLFFMADQHRLRFPLLSDRGNQVAHRFGLVYQVPEYQQAVYRRAFINLPFANGDQSWQLPVPATYIIGRDSRILYAAVDPDYTERPEPAEILAQVRRIRNQGECPPARDRESGHSTNPD